jgi:hypothetical protein
MASSGADTTSLLYSEGNRKTALEGAGEDTEAFSEAGLYSCTEDTPMRMLCLLALSLAPAVSAAQAASQPAPSTLFETLTPKDSRLEVPAIKQHNPPVASVILLPNTANLNTADNVCLTMRVYTHAASNPKKLTGYTECLKADRRSLKNALVLPKLTY